MWLSWSLCLWSVMYQTKGPEDEPGLGSLGCPKFGTHSWLWQALVAGFDILLWNVRSSCILGELLLSWAAQDLLTTTQETFTVTVCLASHCLPTFNVWWPEMRSAVLLCGTRRSLHQLISYCMHRREEGLHSRSVSKKPGGVFSRARLHVQLTATGLRGGNWMGRFWLD